MQNLEPLQLCQRLFLIVRVEQKATLAITDALGQQKRIS